MSRFEELIKEYCPNGIEFYKLKDVCDNIIVPMRDRPKKMDGEIPWCRIEDKEGQYFNKSLSGLGVSEETVKQMNLKVFPTGTVICSCSASIGAYAINTQPLITNQTFIGLVCGNRLLNKYLMYYMETQTAYLLSQATTGTIPYISRKKFEEMYVPVPPLPVQEKIVQILDIFSEYTSELTEELSAELEARKRQYEHYMDQLFVSDIPPSQWKSVKDLVLSLKTGLNPRQNFKLNAGGDKPYITGKDIYNNSINVSKKTDLITDEDIDLINRRACLETNDVLFASTGTGTVGRMAVIEEYKNNWAVSETMFCLKPNTSIIDSYYLMYALYTESAKNQFVPKISKGSVPHLKVKDLLEVKIPVPNLSEQKRLVNLIRKFDKLCNDISSCLPIEIEARQKQYDYYRDKLFTFKQLTV